MYMLGKKEFFQCCVPHIFFVSRNIVTERKEYQSCRKELNVIAQFKLYFTVTFCIPNLVLNLFSSLKLFLHV